MARSILKFAVSALVWRYTLFLVLLLSVLLSWVPLTKASDHSPQPQIAGSQLPDYVSDNQERSLFLQNSTVIAKILRSAGYGLFARTLEILAADKNTAGAGALSWWNGTGTLFVPSDSAFSRTAKTAPLAHNVLLYHAVKRKITWKQMEALPAGTALRTFLEDRCLFLCRTSSGGLCVAAKNQPTANRAALRHPNLYADAALSIHGVDRIVDPAANFSSCAARQTKEPETPTTTSASLLSDAIRFLQNNGYGVVAMAMQMKSSELRLLDKMTVFAPSDETLFAGADGFHFDFRYHVVPHRLPLLELLRLPLGTRLDTLLPGTSIVVTGRVDETAFSVDNVTVKEAEIFDNEVMMVHAVPLPLQPKNVMATVAFSPVATAQLETVATSVVHNASTHDSHNGFDAVIFDEDRGGHKKLHPRDQPVSKKKPFGRRSWHLLP